MGPWKGEAALLNPQPGAERGLARALGTGSPGASQGTSELWVGCGHTFWLYPFGHRVPFNVSKQNTPEINLAHI